MASKSVLYYLLLNVFLKFELTKWIIYVNNFQSDSWFFFNLNILRVKNLKNHLNILSLISEALHFRKMSEFT